MLARLGGGHLYNFAGTSLHDHMSVLAQSRALNRIGVGGTRLGSFEVNNICHGASDKGAERKDEATSLYFLGENTALWVDFTFIGWGQIIYVSGPGSSSGEVKCKGGVSLVAI